MAINSRFAIDYAKLGEDDRPRVFDVVGRCQQTGPAPADQTCAHVPPEIHRDEIPLNGTMIQFREG